MAPAIGGSPAGAGSHIARKHGLFARDAITERKQILVSLGEARKFLQGMK